MSAPSSTASQTDFCNAMYRDNITSEPPSGCDTPTPITRISDETLNTLNMAKPSIEVEYLWHTLKPETKTSRPGTAMGTSLASNYVNLFMHRSEIKCNLPDNLH